MRKKKYEEFKMDKKKTAIVVFVGVFPAVMLGIVLHAIKSEQKKAQSREEDRDARVRLILKAIHANFCVNKELVRCV